MSKKSVDQLFELIKSLTKSEKRYFKLISSRHTIGDENNYIVLFDYLDKLDDYDEKELILHFKGEAFLNNFSITKRRLYDHILNALDAFHQGSSIDAQLYKSIHSADILYNKSLYEQCGKILRSAEKLARKHERFAILLEISKRKKKLLENIGYAHVELQEMAEIVENEKTYIDHLFSYSTLWTLKSELFMELSRRGVSRTDDSETNFKQIFDALNKEIKSNDLSSESMYLAYHAKSAYHYAVHDFEACLIDLQKNMELFQANPVFLAEHPNSYFSVLTNAIFVNEKLGKFNDAKALLQTLKQFPRTSGIDLSEDLQIKLFSSTSSIELSSCLLRGDFSAALELIPMVERGLTLYQDKISPQRRAFLAFKCGTVALGAQKYSEALKWINQVLNDSKLDASDDILAFTHILDLIIHIELKNDKLLPYALKSTERFLKSRNILHNFEKVMLRFVNKLVKTNNVFESEKHWENLYEELVSLKRDSHQNVGLDYFDFESWAKSKIKRQSFEEIIRSKFITLARA